MKYIIIYIVVINLIAFLMFFLDKKYAEYGRWRISEKSLILIALFGGSVGAIYGMKWFRHKTKKPKFYIGLPIILILQIAFILYLCYNVYVI